MAISNSKETHKDQCITFLEGKQHHAVIPSKSNVESPRVLHRMYSDICGPMKMTARKGYCYFVTFIDGYSHHLIVKLIKLKNEVLKLTKEYLEWAEAETGECANYFRSDGGTEDGLTVLQDYFKSKGIHHEMACVMLFDAGLPNTYWGDTNSLCYAHPKLCTYLRDHQWIDTTWSIHWKQAISHTPENFRVQSTHSCTWWKHHKLNAKSVKCTFLGFAENCKAYVCVCMCVCVCVCVCTVQVDKSLSPGMLSSMKGAPMPPPTLRLSIHA